MNTHPILFRLNHTEKDELINNLLSFLSTTIHVVPDPTTNQPTVLASHPFEGTTTLLHLDPDIIQTYRVTCHQTHIEEVCFEIQASCSAEALAFCKSGRDINGDPLDPTDTSFIKTISQDNFLVAPLQPRKPVYNGVPCPPNSNPTTS